MALQVTKLQRVFSFKKDKETIDLPDPNPDFTAEEVMKFYSSSHPDLTTAIVDGPTVVKDKAVYMITNKAGKLG